MINDKIAQRRLSGRTGGVPPDQVKENSTLASGYLGPVTVRSCAETRLVKARTATKVLSSGHGEDDSIVRGGDGAGQRSNRAFGSHAFEFEFLMAIIAVQFIPK